MADSRRRSTCLSGGLLSKIAMDPQESLFQPLGCTAFIVVLILVTTTKRMDLRRPIPFLVLVTLIVTAATPFIQPRYLYSAYILLCDLQRSEFTA